MSRTFDELIALADEQYALYQQNSDNATFDLAIRHYCAAFDLGPAPDTTVDYAISYFRFHHALLLRGQGQGDDTIAYRYLDRALEFTPPTHHLRSVLLGIQATSYTQRYQRTRDAADLHSAVGILQTATDTISVAHPQRAHLLMQYGSALHTRFMVLRDENDLNIAIQQFGMVLEGCPDQLLIPARRSLAFALDSRYKLRHNFNDIDLAIEAYAVVIDTLQQQPREYLLACMGYAMVLFTRFLRKGDLDDLHVAIRYFEIVIRRCQPSHQHYSTALVFYANLLIVRSEQRESIQDIDRAIECIRNGMTAGRADVPSPPELLSTLGYCLVSRFLHCGSVTDLESAAENCYAAVRLDSSLDAGARAGNMNRLAFALFTRYQLQGDEIDSSRAKAYLQQALELCPSDHPIRLNILNNSGRILGNLARKNSDFSNLELSIKCFYEALDLCYASARSTVLTNLAFALLHRYSLLSDLSDIDVSFSLSKTALELQPEDHPFRGRTLLCQAKAVIAMFPRKHNLVDTQIALDILDAARDAVTPGHPLLIETYRELSNVYSLRHSITNSSTDLEDAFNYRIAAAQYSNGGSQVQFEAAMQWVESAERFNHPSLLDAYRSAIRILDLHLVLKPSVDVRHDIIKAIIKAQTLSICADATSCALRRHNVIGAVEMFEHSRGLFWTFMARLRTPLDELRASGPGGRDLADEFETLSHQLETPMTLGDDGEYGQRFRRIQRDWNAVVDKIRSADGFNQFLLPPSYEDLRAAAIGGPVIILNASRHSCDAVIVLADSDAEPVHIAFQEGTFSEMVTMSSDFELVRRSLRQYPTDSNSQEKEKEERRLAGLLRGLWYSIVCEVVRSLEPHVPKNSRIWWCPTGVFTSLPIHAAHPYRKGERGLSDVYVSSYTPTLSALIRSRNKRNTQQSVPSFVSIGQPNAAGYNLLVSVRQELDLVRQLLPEAVQFTELSDEAATREAALTALCTHTFAHLACHGEQVPGRPYDSHFAMHDGKLTLLDIIHSQLGHETEFAFLSACKTATGDVEAPDEVIHLAAALQFAGVRNVVGTMWSVDDQVVGYTVEAFYRAMVREDGVFDPSRAARALRAATRATKDRVPLEQRIVFIHIGV